MGKVWDKLKVSVREKLWLNRIVFRICVKKSCVKKLCWKKQSVKKSVDYLVRARTVQSPPYRDAMCASPEAP